MPETEAVNQTVIWKPNPGPQLEYVGSIEREVLYGGAAGGGKSDGLLMSAAMEVRNRYHRAIIFRRTFPELKDLIRRSEELYPHLGGRYLSSRREWRFPSGAIIEFGYIDKKSDIPKYKRAWNFIGWDELTHWPDDEPYVFLLGRLRAVTNSGLTLRVRSATNPGGVGHGWVRSRFNIPGDGTRSEVYDTDTNTYRIFIPARVVDNPFLSGTSYEKDLDALPLATRRMLKDGRWDIVEGAMYSEFDHRRHTVQPFAINANWPIWRGGDDGYNAPACVLWFTRHDRRTYVIGELYRNAMTAEMMAEEVLKRDKLIAVAEGDQDPVYNEATLDGIIDSSAFNRSGVEGIRRDPSDIGRGQKMNALGCNWKPAQKGPGSRVAGCNLIHSAMRPLEDGLPGIRIFTNCKNLIRVIPIIPRNSANSGDPEDVDQDFQDDHPHDALKYGLQYRQAVVTLRRLRGT